MKSQKCEKIKLLKCNSVLSLDKKLEKKQWVSYSRLGSKLSLAQWLTKKKEKAPKLESLQLKSYVASVLTLWALGSCTKFFIAANNTQDGTQSIFETNMPSCQLSSGKICGEETW